MIQPVPACLILIVFFNYCYAVLQETLVMRELGMRFHVLAPPMNGSSLKVDDQWFEQRLDHFDGQNTQKWEQRYFSRYLCLFEGKICFFLKLDN